LFDRAAQAAIRAGYSAKTARKIGSENLTKLDISEAIETARNAHAEHAGLTAEMVLTAFPVIGGLALNSPRSARPAVSTA